MKTTATVLMLALACSMYGCGGSDDDAPAPTPPSAPEPEPMPGPAVTIHFDQAFVAGTQARYLLMSNSQSISAPLERHVQQSSGAVTQLGEHDIADMPNFTPLEASGNAHYALGRWAEAETDASRYYLVMNSLPAVPTSGETKVCGDLRTTSMRPVGWGVSQGNSGALTAQATIRFDTEGAHVDLKVLTAVDEHTLEHDLSGTVPPSNPPSAALMVPQGYFRSNVNVYHHLGTAVTLGDGGNGDIILGAIVNVNIDTGRPYVGTPYMGSLVMTCR